MDCLTFVSKVFEALSWPLVTIIMAFLLRSPLANMIQQIVQIKYKDFEVSFGAKIAELKADYAEAKQLPEDDINRIKKLCKDAPVQTIKNEWNDLREITYKTLKKLFPDDSLQAQRLSPKRALTALTSTGA